jgi:hypothetical protein
VAADLKYRLIAGLGHVAYCDPDLYPLGRLVSDAAVSQRLATAQAQDPTTYAAALAHFGWTATTLTPNERRAVYQDLKELQALQLTSAGDGYRFSYTTTAQAGHGGGGTRVDGAIDATGRISVTGRSPNTVTCPV